MLPIVLVCIKCDLNPYLDSKAGVWVAGDCPIHGRAWHRRMVQGEHGLELADPRILYPIGKSGQSSPRS